jgi:hypothetical protein
VYLRSTYQLSLSTSTRSIRTRSDVGWDWVKVTLPFFRHRRATDPAIQVLDAHHLDYRVRCAARQ